MSSLSRLSIFIDHVVLKARAMDDIKAVLLFYIALCSSFIHISVYKAQFKQHTMVGTIRRPLPGVNTNSGDSGAPPPPSYQAATSPTSSSSSGANRQSGIPAAAFQRQQQQGGSNSTGRPFSTPDASMYNNNNQAARPLSQASIPSQRPGSYAAPPGAPPGQPQYQQKSSSASYQQPMGSPPRSASSSSAGPSHAPAGGAQVQRSNSQEDRLAVCKYSIALLSWRAVPPIWTVVLHISHETH